MAVANAKKAAKEFIERWRGRGDEKQDAQSFWRDLLVNVLGVSSATLANFVSFERKVPGGYIDVFIEDTGVLVEQKSIGINLEKEQQQSDGAMLTPYGQGARYASRLPLSIRPRWIIACNFERMLIYDQETDPTGEHPQELLLEDLPNELYRLAFVTDKSNSRIEREKELSVKAGEIVGKLYKSFAAQYRNLETDEHEQRSLNMLIVRLVFLLYAEDAGLFNSRGALYDYLKPFPPEQMRRALMELFDILDTPEDERDPYARPDLLEFRYVNGGLFADRYITIPQITDQIKLDLLVEASSKFDWSGVSPTIFGAVFESTLNPETRRSGGMHYTSVENIHKVIDPLFLDDLRAELERIEGLKSERDRRMRLKAFQRKLSQVNVFDPACGSGNFLTESYLSLRKLENRAIEGLQKDGTGQLGFEGDTSPIMVSLSQFHGIEINDFAVSVAKTAMWIAESQMIEATQEIVYQVIDFLPLKSSCNIHEGNALRMDWNDVLPAKSCTFICGNPPFYGSSMCSDEQKQEIVKLYTCDGAEKVKLANSLDYVTGWYYKACQMMSSSNAVRAAFVSTSSITQGEQVYPIWHTLTERFGVNIDFAWRSFVWDSEAAEKAHVHVVVIGFSGCGGSGVPTKFIFDEHGAKHQVKSINPYLIDAPAVIPMSRKKPLCNVPPLSYGNKPTDSGLFILTDEERAALLAQEPTAAEYIREYVGAKEFLNGKTRWCLWLLGREPDAFMAIPAIAKRVEGVRAFRAASSAKDTRKRAEVPWEFFRTPIHDTPYMAVPRTSSENRPYLPIGFFGADTIPSDATSVIPNADLYQFGVLESRFHAAWMRVVAGRLESRYRYSGDVVYNNYVWPEPTPRQREHVIANAQKVLEARDAHPGDSLAMLYDPDKMPDDLREAHAHLDKAVEEAYGVSFNGDEEKIVAHLFKLYAVATKET